MVQLLSMTYTAKLIEEALKILPEKFGNHPNTRVIMVQSNPLVLVAANPEFAPIKYKEDDKEWTPIIYGNGGFDSYD